MMKELIEDKIEALQESSLNKTKINAAGKALKNIVLAVIYLILFSAFGIFITFTSLKDPEKIKTIYMILGIISVLCNIFILYSLYKAGDHLENS